MTAIPLGGGTLDRAAERRADPPPASSGLALSLDDGAITPLDGRGTLAFLGITEAGEPLWLLEGPPSPDLRARLTSEPDPAHQGLLAYAAQLSWFHHTHRFCGRCGQPTEPADAGHARRCPQGHQVHPRTDPVVIMLVADGAERVLLGRQPGWPAGRYSALAGFVEPGETIEAAVAREVLEEAGMRTGAVRFLASQPWPFPQSLMLGFHAAWAGGGVDGDPSPRDAELEDVRWCSRDEVAAAAQHDVGWVPTDDAGLVLPPRLAIARHLIEDWLASPAG